jgi:hypothetical protein
VLVVATTGGNDMQRILYILKKEILTVSIFLFFLLIGAGQLTWGVWINSIEPPKAVDFHIWIPQDSIVVQGITHTLSKPWLIPLKELRGQYEINKGSVRPIIIMGKKTDSKSSDFQVTWLLPQSNIRFDASTQTYLSPFNHFFWDFSPTIVGNDTLRFTPQATDMGEGLIYTGLTMLSLALIFFLVHLSTIAAALKASTKIEITENPQEGTL